MTQTFAVLSSAIWAQRRDLEAVLSARLVRPHFVRAGALAGVVGWGHKDTGLPERDYARRHDLPYIALEDGFLRSLRSGPSEASLSFAIDRQGIYYNAAGPSDMEDAIVRAAQADVPEVRSRAREAIATLRRLRLSKYNAARDVSPAGLGLSPTRNRVLVVDQIAGDASVVGAGASATSFEFMLAAAISENPGVEIVVKTHPDALAGSQTGYLRSLSADRGVTIVTSKTNPWSLLDAIEKVYVVSSQLGFEALMAGLPVVCFGNPFYAGWGLTDDRVIAPSRRSGYQVDIEHLFAAAFFDYCRYLDVYDRTLIPFETAVEQLAFLRDRFMGNPPCVVAGLSRWKRLAVDRLLDGPEGPPRHTSSLREGLELAARSNCALASWGNDQPGDIVSAAADAGVSMTRIEDGFIRSVGLGATFTPPASLVFDRSGLYLDATRASDFELLIQSLQLDTALRTRAIALIDDLVSFGISKYNVGTDVDLDLPADREIVLVPGQVEGDASLRFGSPEITSNADLLCAVRRRRPEAYVIYKPHPDVESGFKPGHIREAAVLEKADRVVTRMSIASLLARCDRVDTMTSLAGFEALVHGVKVATYGAPFYAGWGLTEDMVPMLQRQRTLDLPELVAATLILYPVYLDPISQQPCPVEKIIARFRAELSRTPTQGELAQAKLRALVARARHRIIGRIKRRVKNV